MKFFYETFDIFVIILNELYIIIIISLQNYTAFI